MQTICLNEHFMSRTTLIIFLTICISCTNSEKTSSEFEQKFDKVLIDHMVNRDLAFFHQVAFYPNIGDTTVKELNHLGAWAIHTYKVNPSEIIDIKKEFDLGNKSFTSDSTSNCINCPREFDCDKAESTTPSFYFLMEKLKIEATFLPDDFQIFLLESKKGEFLPRASLTLDWCDETEWRHGYTKGVVLNESYGLVAFWTTAW